MYFSDYGSDGDIEEDSNIYQNKGDGLKFYALNGKNAIILATFNIKSRGKVYKVDYTTDIFDTNGKTKDGFELFTMNDKLTLKLSDGTQIRTFAVRPINTNLRVGDDFLLRFGLQNDNSVEGVASDEDFMAVYDINSCLVNCKYMEQFKGINPLLWRANLYIDETDDMIGHIGIVYKVTNIDNRDY